MNREAAGRLGQYLAAQGAEAALLSSPFTITWLTGYAAPIETGPSPFEAGPAVGWWRDGELTLILSDTEGPSAQECGVRTREYAAYALDQPLRATDRQVQVLTELLREHGALEGRVGVERDFLPAALAETLHLSLPHATLLPIDEDLPRLRILKTAQEIGRIRASLELCDLGQAYIRDHVAPGMTELDLWTGMKGHLEIAAGSRLPVVADLIAGARAGGIEGSPTAHALQEGDAVILDVVPRLNGYWGDNAGTYFAGEPRAELRAIYSVVRDALYRAIDAIRPGVSAGEIDELLRGEIKSAGHEPYPHHSGHGLGTANHEHPRLVPGNEMRLEAGMVLAVEPGIYLGERGGVRLEHAVLVTEDGCEVLTRHLA